MVSAAILAFISALYWSSDRARSALARHAVHCFLLLWTQHPGAAVSLRRLSAAAVLGTPTADPFGSVAAPANADLRGERWRAAGAVGGFGLEVSLDRPDRGDVRADLSVLAVPAPVRLPSVPGVLRRGEPLVAVSRGGVADAVRDRERRF